MFGSKIDHSSYLHEDFDSFFTQEGFPYFRYNRPQDAKTADEEKLILLIHGNKPNLLLLTNMRILLFKLPVRQSLLKRAVGEGVSFIPGVGEAMDLVDGFKDIKKGTTGFTGWISGSKRKEKERRALLGLPSKKDYKDLKYKLKNPDDLSLISGYQDHILLANGFEWKCTGAFLTGVDQLPIVVEVAQQSWIFNQGEKTIRFKYKEFEPNIENLLSKILKEYQSCLEPNILELSFS